MASTQGTSASAAMNSSMSSTPPPRSHTPRWVYSRRRKAAQKAALSDKDGTSALENNKMAFTVNKKSRPVLPSVEKDSAPLPVAMNKSSTSPTGPNPHGTLSGDTENNQNSSKTNSNSHKRGRNRYNKSKKQDQSKTATSTTAAEQDLKPNDTVHTASMAQASRAKLESVAARATKNMASTVQHAKKTSPTVQPLPKAGTDAAFPALPKSPSTPRAISSNGSQATTSVPATPVVSFPHDRKNAGSATSATPSMKSAEASKPSSQSQVVEQDVENLLEMIRPKRKALLEGPRITVHIGDTSVTGISKRAAMAASSALHKHFVSNPESVEYHFSRGQIHPGAVRALLIRWIEDISVEFEAYAVPAQETFAEDVALIRASRILGMQMYCSHITAEYINYLKSQLPSYEEIVAVEKNALSDKDPLWTAMVNHLCHERYKGLIPDPDDFEKFLDGHHRLKKSMEEADAFFAKMAAQYAEAREAERRARWEKNEEDRQERRERISQERRTAKALKQKLDTKGSGLMTVTPGEAELLRGRMLTG